MDAGNFRLRVCFPILYHGCLQIALKGNASGIEGCPVGFSLFQSHAVIGLVGKALSRVIRRKSEIVGICPVHGTSHYIFHPSFAMLLCGAPAVTAVQLRIIISHRAVAVQEFKGSVFNHFRIQTAVCRIIDVLKKKADHAFPDWHSLFV